MTAFTIPGIPAAKGRPRFLSRGGFIRAYTDQKTVAYEALVGLYAQQAGIEPVKGPIAVTIRAFWPSKGAPRKRTPRPEAWRVGRPDLDNVIKAILDGLEGIAFDNDSQVVVIAADKRHAAQGCPPHVDVTVEAVAHAPEPTTR